MTFGSVSALKKTAIVMFCLLTITSFHTELENSKRLTENLKLLTDASMSVSQH